MVSSSKRHGKKSGKKPTPASKKAGKKQAVQAKKPVKVQTVIKKPTPGKLAPKSKHVITVPARPTPKPVISGLREVPDAPMGQRQGTGYRMAADRIDGETIIGDLIVVFPRTREALLRHGLKLDVDEAGDIYMTLDAFAAIHGLKTSALVEELVQVSRLPPVPVQPVQPLQRVPQLATAPSTG